MPSQFRCVIRDCPEAAVWIEHDPGRAGAPAVLCDPHKADAEASASAAVGFQPIDQVRLDPDIYARL